jgi:hypothetical protein
VAILTDKLLTIEAGTLMISKSSTCLVSANMTANALPVDDYRLSFFDKYTWKPSIFFEVHADLTCNVSSASSSKMRRAMECNNMLLLLLLLLLL